MKAEKVENDQTHGLMSQEKQGYRKGSLDRPLKFKFDKLFIKYDNLYLVDDGLVVRRVSVQLFSYTNFLFIKVGILPFCPCQ